MKIENNEKIYDKDFSLIEEHYGCSLSTEIKEFLKKFNGEIVQPEYAIEIEYTTFSGRSLTDSFSNIYHTKEIIRQLRNIGYIEDFFDEDELSRDDVETEYLLPIMEVCGGSLNLYIAIYGNHKNKIFIVDNGDFGICKVEVSLTEISSKLNKA